MTRPAPSPVSTQRGSPPMRGSGTESHSAGDTRTWHLTSISSSNNAATCTRKAFSIALDPVAALHGTLGFRQICRGFYHACVPLFMPTGDRSQSTVLDSQDNARAAYRPTIIDRTEWRVRKVYDPASPRTMVFRNARDDRKRSDQHQCNYDVGPSLNVAGISGVCKSGRRYRDCGDRTDLE